MRTRILLVLVLLLIAMNSLFFITHQPQTDEELLAEWVALMPALEAKQRANPTHLIRSSHHWDADYPMPYIVEEDEALHVFPKIAAKCRLTEYWIDSYAGPRNASQANQMPERWFAGQLNPQKVKCFRANLPRGYVLRRLAKPTRPTEVEWCHVEF